MTPHIEAKKDDIAKTVIMPGDPLRAKMIAETYLDNPRLVSSVRGIYAYTGMYKGKEVTIMASGMGMASMGIYSYELYKFYEVEEIIRVGSCGAYTRDLNLYDIILVNSCYTDSSYSKVQCGVEKNIEYSDTNLNFYLRNAALKLNIPVTIAEVYSSDVFYKEKDNYQKLYREQGVLAVEMESFALFHNAKILNKKAACLLTVSDNLETNEKTTSDERQNSFKNMILIALESII